MSFVEKHYKFALDIEYSAAYHAAIRNGDTVEQASQKAAQAVADMIAQLKEQHGITD